MRYRLLKLLAAWGIASVATPCLAATPSLSMGAMQSCAVQSSGAIRCWQFFDYVKSIAPIPSVVDASSVSVANEHACYTSSGGASYCWGGNSSGQLGTGDLTPHTSPVAVTGLTSGVVATHAGEYHSCALLANGGVKCWGGNSYGQLGTGNNTASTLPVNVVGLPGPAIALSVNILSSCAIVEGGDVWCWGTGQAAEAAGGVPTRIGPAGLGAVQFSTDQNALCVVVSGGAVKCLAAGSSLEPVAGLESGIVQVATLNLTSCALHVSGDVYCWGYGHNGLLGSDFSGFSASPRRLDGAPPGIVSLAMANNSACAVTVFGAIKCWGLNNFGQLGTTGPEFEFSSTMAPVLGLPAGATRLSVGMGNVCAAVPGDNWYCWGDNSFGQVGDGTLSHRRQPVNRFAIPGPAARLSAGAASACAQTEAGHLWCAGQRPSFSPDPDALPVRVVGGDGLPIIVNEVALGGDRYACARDSSSVRCWGITGSGAIGQGDNFAALDPTLVAGIVAPVSSISAGFSTTCAVGNSRVWCWGYNASGQVGDGTTTQRSTPTEVASAAGIAMSVVVGPFHVCALVSSGGPLCWGANDVGQLDGIPGTTLSPRVASALPANPSKLSIGTSHTCALKNGVVTCLGGTWAPYFSMASLVAQFPTDIIDIASVWDTFCALRSTGQVVCVGSNLAGRLGRGVAQYRTEPFAFVPNINLWGNASVSASAAPFLTGEPLTLTATLPGPSVGGTVAFKIDGASVSGCTAVPVSLSGAICSTIVPGAGTRTVTIEYSGDSNHPALSAQTTIAVTGGLANTTSLTVPPFAIKGQTVPLLVQVSGTSGIATGSVTITGTGVNCSVTLTAGQGQCNLFATALGWQVPLTASFPGDATYRPTTGTAVLTVVAQFDVNADGNRDARDGLIMARYLLGIRGAALLDGIDNAGALRTTPTAITTYLGSIKNSLDIDLDGRWTLATDGVLLVRYLLGLRGTALTSGAMGSNAFRTASALVESYIRNFAE